MMSPPKIIAALERCAPPPTLPQSLEAVEVANGAWAGQSVPRLSLDGIRLINCDLTAAQLVDSSWADVVVEGGILAGAGLGGASIRRIELSQVRADGVVMSETEGRDIVIRGSKLNLANFRYAKWSRVAFIDCSLREADFMGAQLSDVTLKNCDLTGAQFSAATCKNVSLDGSRLESINGLTGLKGATISTGQLMTLAPELARTLGITIQD